MLYGHRYFCSVSLSLLIMPFFISHYFTHKKTKCRVILPPSPLNLTRDKMWDCYLIVEVLFLTEKNNLAEIPEEHTKLYNINQVSGGLHCPRWIVFDEKVFGQRTIPQSANCISSEDLSKIAKHLEGYTCLSNYHSKFIVEIRLQVNRALNVQDQLKAILYLSNLVESPILR